MKKLFLLTMLTIGKLASQLQAQGDVTRPGDPIIGGQMIGGVFVAATQGTPAGNANMYPSVSIPAAAINDSTSDYRNFGEINTGFIVTPIFNSRTGGSFVTKMIFLTAENSPERDPLTFTLEGTNGDPFTGNYTLIASGSTGFDTDPGRSHVGPTVTFPGVGAATSYRVIFPTVRNPALADSMQIGEVLIIGLAAPEPSALTLLSISAIGLIGARRKRAVAV